MKRTVIGLLFIVLSLSLSVVSGHIFEQHIQNVSQTITNIPYYYVDNNTSNMDYMDDIGAHSNFTAQQYGPDASFDILTEENISNNVTIEDFVDTNLSNVDSSGDKGTHSNFTAQQFGPDTLFDTLTEASVGSDNTHSIDASGGYMLIGDGSPDWGSTAGTISFWVKMDGTVQGRFWGQDGNMETRWSGTNLVLDWGGDGSMISATSFLADTWYFVAIVWDENNNNLFLYIGDETNPPMLDTNSLSATWFSTTPLPTQNLFMNGVGANQPVDGHGEELRYWNVARSLGELQSDYNVELVGSETNLQSYFQLNNDFDDIGPNNNDGSGSGSYGFSTDVPFNEVNYELDLEVQWNDVVEFLPTEELCIYAGTLGSENLRVDYWNGLAWENLATDLTSDSWNNYTVSLTSTSFTTRFTGGTEMEDTSQDHWAIDAILLRSEGTGSKEDAVDNDTSNVDSSSDLGNLLNFDNMKSSDSNYANLTESAPEGSIMYINAAEASATFGTSAQINKPTNTEENDFMITLLVSTIGSDPDGSTMASAPPGWTSEHNYTQSTASGQHVYLYWKIASASEPSNYTWTWTSWCGWVAQIITFRGVDPDSPIHVNGVVNQESSSSPMSPSITTTEDNCMIWLYDMSDADAVPYSGGAPSSTTWIDRTEISTPGNGIGISSAYFTQASSGATGNKDWTLDAIEENSAQQYALKPASLDCRLDHEIQWTNIPYSLPNETLSIYGGSMDDEDIEVDVWNGTNWELLLTDLSLGWNNVSITDWLTSTTFTIRLRDGIDAGDPNPDTWQIDLALIHLWTGEEFYELDLEAQWTGVDFSETNEELCVNFYHAINNTYSLDATGGYMLIGDGSPDWGSTAGTISFWVKMDGTVQGRFWGQDGNMETRWSGSNLVLDWGGTASMTSATSFSADTWYFVAIVWDETANDLLLYIGDENNVPILDTYSLNGTWTGTTPVPTENRFLNGVGGNEPVNGRGDELRYWNITRSLTELQSDYNNTLNGSESGLRSYYRLDNSFNDEGPDANTGSAFGSFAFATDVPFTSSTSESLQVDIWTGTEWQNVFASLTIGWNNVTVTSYLTASTFTIRFIDTIETNDASQDSWSIDALLLHVWT